MSGRVGGAAVVAWGAISARGEGEVAAGAGEVGEPARCAVSRDAELADAGLARPFAGRAIVDASDGDRATILLAYALDACAKMLDVERPAWRTGTIGLAMGTSSGGMRTAERFFRGEPVTPHAATYFGPLHDALALAKLTTSPSVLVLGACASGALAIGLGLRWIEAGRCDLVLAGGFDAVSVFVASGFEALRATTAAPPSRPFRKGRDGLALGEGAGILALAPASTLRRPARAYVAGFGASCDATHVTAPDRTGGGLARAAIAALEDAQVAPSAIDLVSPHATATPFNDAAEHRALVTALGPEAALRVPVAPLKAELGHTLGAAGALESLAAIDALARGVVPAAAGEGEIDPDAPANLLPRAIAAPLGAALKLSSAFGGANAALVLTRDAPRPRERAVRPVYVTRAVRVSAPLAALTARVPAAMLARADDLVRLALSALCLLETEIGPLAGAGIVVGHALATLETNATYDAKIRAQGARAAEPRRFPYTSPNAVCGECAVAFGLTGPAFATGGGLHGALEALAVASDLVAAGDASRIVVVAVDEIGPAAARLGDLGSGLTSGAAALLVTSDPHAAFARVASTVTTLGPAAPTATVSSPGNSSATPLGHVALSPLADPKIRLPICLSAAARGSFAEVRLIGVKATVVPSERSL